MTINTARLTAASIGVLLALSACSSAKDATSADASIAKQRLDSSGPYYLPASADAREFLAIQASRTAAADGLYYDRTLTEALPNNLVAINGAAETTLSGAIVTGTVTAVDRGQAYGIEGRDADGGTAIAFDDPAAAWRVAVVTINADHNLTRSNGNVIDRPGEVKVGVVIAGDTWQQQMDGIKALKDVVVILDSDRTYDFQQPALPAVARNGALFGDVDANGFIGFPALDQQSADYVGNLDTVPELVAAATAPDIHRTLDLVDGVLTQVIPAVPLNTEQSPTP